MARGGKVGCKRNIRNSVRLDKKDSDVSDEDYMVSEDEEFIISEDEYCSLAEDESDESLGEFLVDEEEEEDSVKRKKSTTRKGFQGRKSSRLVNPRKKKESNSGDEIEDNDFFVSKPKRRNVVSYKEDEDEDEDEDDDIDDVSYKQEDHIDFVDERPRTKTRVSCTEKDSEKPRRKTKVSHRDETEEGESNDSYDDTDDEEFTPDEFDGVDEEEETPVIKKNKPGRLRGKESQIATRGLKRKRSKRKKPVKEQVPRKSDRGKKRGGENTVSRKKIRTNKPVRRRKSSLNSDSDFVTSGPSDYEYTVSEEEREQIREAGEYCQRPITNLRSSKSVKAIVKEEEKTLPVQQTKRPGRKGKEKVADLKVSVGKPVCGICLTEEGKRTIRGILNCCNHHFCFSCIMEWSKVESRCPLCKQRFTTICRMARADGVHDLRDSVITVPERDQVYQPSEEELLGYLDPYENFFCTECHQGGDDALMLLCDLCDSPAHSYCVGLGREVPEGNWYCDGCRPTALAASNPTPEQNPSNNNNNNNLPQESSPVGPVREFDLNELYVPETPLSQLNGNSVPSPRHNIGYSQTNLGLGASTVHDRRRIHRQIHQFITNMSRRHDRTDNGSGPISGISLFGSRISTDEVIAQQQGGVAAPQNGYHQGRLVPEYNNNMAPGFSPRLGSLRGQVMYNQASTSTNRSLADVAPGGSFGLSPRMGQIHPLSRGANGGADAGVTQVQFREANRSSLENGQVESIVRNRFQ